LARERIKFYTDENVPTAVTEGLRRRGVEVLTAQRANLRQAADSQHLALALAEGRVSFTLDADFLHLHATGEAHAGIVYAPQLTPTGTQVRGLMLIYDVLSPEDMTRHVEFM
jgi:Domain of unknown function (DUF5615)